VDQREKATALRRMHREPPILVLPNAWDVASAKALAAVPGCRAVATSSAAVARALGWEDGERAPRAEMLEAARRDGCRRR
jgi:2-methylisocitrate lyase-like PEP mutase family enzyme